MSVSGRKSAGFQDSLSKGSTEDFDVCCDPCLLTGQNAEAKGFCLDCQENLCKTCLDYHKKIKALRNHRLQGHVHTGPAKTTVQDSSMSCTEPCQVHQTEVIKFFCPVHEAVGCSDCMTLDHRTCKLDYIPDICADIIKSQEFQKTLQDVIEIIKRAEDLDKKSRSTKAENKTIIEEAIREIELFQKKINDRLEQLKRNMIQDAQIERSMHDRNVDKVLRTTDLVSTSLQTLLTGMQESQTKNQNIKAFIIMKQTQFKMKTLNMQSAEDELSVNRMKFVFEPNKGLEEVLSMSDGLGKLRMYKNQLVTNVSFKSLILENEINVRTKSDKKTCSIRGCATIQNVSAHKILLADWGNKKLKVLDIGQQSVVDEKNLESSPLDIAVLPQNMVAVTLPEEKKILLLGITGQISTISSISVNRWCTGITYHQDLLYVLCPKPNCLLVLDMKGTVRRDIALQAALNETFVYSSRIYISNDGKSLNVTDRSSKFVASLTLTGNVTGVYKNDEMKNPAGLVELPDGSLLVCCWGSGTLYRVSSDLKHGNTLTEGVTGARSICYQPDYRKIIVGSDVCNNIKIFGVK